MKAIHISSFSLPDSEITYPYTSILKDLQMKKNVPIVIPLSFLYFKHLEYWISQSPSLYSS